MITLVPVGGLANRMKAIDSSLHLARDTESVLRVVWFRNDGLNCPFNRLFEPIAGVQLEEASLMDGLIVDRPRLRNLYFPRLWHALRYDAVCYERQATQRFYDGFDFASWSKGRDVYLASCVYFYPTGDERRFTSFRPVDALRRRIDAVTALFADHTIGVHIRRTDNAASIQESPTHLFIQRMEQELALCPDARFYLATDSEEDKQNLAKRFGSHLITSPYAATRSSVEGMEQALVELYSLSRTRKILGSTKSSYSETAAQIGGIACEIVKQKQI